METNITITTTPLKSCAFGNLEIFSHFVCGTSLYKRTSNFCINNETYNAVEMSAGNFAKFSDNEMVYPVDIEIIISTTMKVNAQY